MDYFGRQSCSQINSGQFRPYWLPHNQPGQPPVLVVQVPVPVRSDNNCYDPDKPTVMQKSNSRAQRNRDSKWRQSFMEKKSVCAIMPFHGLEGQDLSSEIQNGVDDQQEVKLSSKLSIKALFYLEGKLLGSSMPGAELTDKEFWRLFSRPTCQPDIHVAVNDTLVSSLKLADTKTEELQNKIFRLESSNISEQQQHSAEIDQSTETLSFHRFNNELLRLRIADLEERNRQLQESNKIVNSACERLIRDNDSLSEVVQSCLANLDTYKRRTAASPPEREWKGDETQGQDKMQDFQQPPSEVETNCERCCVVRAFYKVSSPT